MPKSFLWSALSGRHFCRYDGGSKPHPKIVKLCRLGFCVPVCPEKLSGLPTPRPPCEQLDGQIICKNGQNVTGQFLVWCGKGFADLVYLPLHKDINKPAILMELKWNKSAKTAITQIKERQYPKSLEDYAGEILLVGIDYQKETKEHTCVIERCQK